MSVAGEGRGLLLTAGGGDFWLQGTLRPQQCAWVGPLGSDGAGWDQFQKTALHTISISS